MTTPLGRVILSRLEKLLEERRARGVATSAHLTETHISKWRNGHIPFNPKLSTLEQLAAALDTTVANLVTDPRDRPSELERKRERARNLRAAQAALAALKDEDAPEE